MQEGKPMKKKTCFECGGHLELFRSTRKGVAYQAYRCKKCGEVTFDMQQAETYWKAAEESKKVTFSQWGQSLGLRIPKELVKALKLKPKQSACIFAEDDGLRIVPIPG